MSGLPILDLVIGLIFIFFLLSIITSSAVEVILTLFRIRAGILARWLREVFNQTALHPTGVLNTGVTLGQAIMDHCMTTVLSGENKSTTYIKSSDFVNAFLDQITIQQAATPPAVGQAQFQMPPTTIQEYIAAIAVSPVISGELKRTIIALANEASKTFGVSGQFTEAVTEVRSDIDMFKEKLENWYDSNTERLIGRLKRRWAFPLTALLAALVTIGLNADPTAMGKYFYDNQAAAKTFADNAVAVIGTYKEKIDKIADTATAQPKTVKDLQASVNAFQSNVASFQDALPKDFPIGWKAGLFQDKGWGTHIPGWIGTVLAILMGAPFWFELLNKVANLRGAGPKPASSLDDLKRNTTINP